MSDFTAENMAELWAVLYRGLHMIGQAKGVDIGDVEWSAGVESAGELGQAAIEIASKYLDAQTLEKYARFVESAVAGYSGAQDAGEVKEFWNQVGGALEGSWEDVSEYAAAFAEKTYEYKQKVADSSFTLLNASTIGLIVAAGVTGLLVWLHPQSLKKGKQLIDEWAG